MKITLFFIDVITWFFMERMGVQVDSHSFYGRY